MIPLTTIDAFLAFWLENPVLPPEHQAVLDHYYRSYKTHFGPYLRHWYARQTAELSALTAAHPGLRVLEVGCGCGTEALWTALHGASVTGIDISEDLLEVARQRKTWLETQRNENLDCTLLSRSILNPAGLGPFDVIYMEQAFHHLEPRAEVIAITARLLAPGGRIILSESNAWNPLVQAALLRSRGTRTIITHLDQQWGNERITTPAAVLRGYAKYGLKQESLRYFRTLPNHPLADKLLWLDRGLPNALRPVFTHYNLVLKRPG
jgi:2-polyprenyl-3-methyl-5-hydroxy-6-metoxy-1,4-benzoquinol methylase